MRPIKNRYLFRGAIIEIFFILSVTLSLCLEGATTTSAPLTITTEDSRTAFYRMEEKANLKITLTNRGEEPLEGASIHLSGSLQESEKTVELIAGGATLTVDLPMDTTLRPDAYPLKVGVYDKAGQPLGEPITLTMTIVPRPLQQRMPVILWGSGNMEKIKAMGFTHYFAIWQGSTAPAVNFANAEGLRKIRSKVDRAMAAGVGSLAKITIGRNRNLRTTYNRIDRKGRTYPALNGQFPEVQRHALELGNFVATHFGDLPGFKGALINTEVRDHTRPSHHPIDANAYKEATGNEIPLEIDANAQGVRYSNLADFPATRIIPDDHPILAYYRWFWKEGDGWNHLHTLIHQGIQSARRPDVWTFFDPAVRAPSLYGSGGDVDYLSQWTYSYPDPLKVNLAGDELLAMAGGHPRQQIMNMTQAIWYRSQTAALPRDEEGASLKTAPWEAQKPDARFISISPDHLSEMLWLKLSQPVQAIMYHGWGSLEETASGGYDMTNAETPARLKQLLQTVVEPLGPMLRQIGDAPTDVAFLESFASQIFARRGTYGWGRGWGADAYLIARYSGLQPQIVYDETILTRSLNGFSILFAPHCDVLTQKVVAEIKRFQQRGGIVIGDQYLAPGLEPDILLSAFSRSDDAEKDKALLLEKAAELKTELQGFYQPPFESDHPNVILRRRGSGELLFAVNDHRTFGDYVGQYRRVMEKGLPSKATLRWQRPGDIIYDLSKRQIVATKTVEDGVEFPVELGAGEGRLFLALPRPVGKLEIHAPKEGKRDGALAVAIRLTDDRGQPIAAVVPMEVTIRDPEGNPAEWSGHYGAASGELKLMLHIASNDVAGNWTIETVEGISGRRSLHSFEVD